MLVPNRQADQIAAPFLEDMGHQRTGRGRIFVYASTEPCPMCLGAIYWARPDRVWYAATVADAADAGFDDDFIYQELDRPRKERHLPMQQLASDDHLEPFRAWGEKVDRTDY